MLQIDDYSLVGFQGLDVTDEESIHSVLVNIDTAIQYGEDMEHKESKVSLSKTIHVLLAPLSLDGVLILLAKSSSHYF